MARVSISVQRIVRVFRTNQMLKQTIIGTVSFKRKSQSVHRYLTCCKYRIIMIIRMFDVFIITEEPPDCRLVIFDDDVEVDHGQGEDCDHGQLQPHLEHNSPGLGYDSRHPGSHRSHSCFVYYPYLLTNSKWENYWANAMTHSVLLL